MYWDKLSEDAYVKINNKKKEQQNAPKVIDVQKTVSDFDRLLEELDKDDKE